MKNRTWFRNAWDSFKSNFWFLPTCMSVSAIAACVLLLFIDGRTGSLLPAMGAGSLNTMRSTLAVLIGALVTALSIAFSSTVVVLTLAASQLGPRLLRIYVRDRSNQVLIGIFSSAVFYNLTALYVIGRIDEAGTVPNLTILGSFLMTCAALFVLIYFIHHVARSIQAPNVILSIAGELRTLVETFYADEDASGRKDTGGRRHQEVASLLPEKQGAVTSRRSGYIQALDVKTLVEIASKSSCVIRVIARPGDFVMEGEPLANIHGRERPGEGLESVAAAAFYIGNNRTATQDLEFVLLELVEIAVRALSPGINDPFTASTCVDRLTEALCSIADSGGPRPCRYDEKGKLRVVLNETDFDGYMDAAFNQIRQYAQNDASVLIHLLESFEKIMKRTERRSDKKTLWRHSCMVYRAGQRLKEPQDRSDIQKRFKSVLQLYRDPSPTESVCSPPRDRST